MYTALLSDQRLYVSLVRFDEDLAAQTKQEGCSCGGVLHRADYPRKSRGGPAGLGREYDRRQSFCCARQECRTRATPPSVRFLGRKVYLGVVIVLVTAMAHGLTVSRIDRLSKEIGVSLRTLRRWRKWWREIFTATPFWKRERGRILPPVDEDGLPGSLLERFTARMVRKRLEALLRFISPVTTTWSCAKSPYFMEV